MLRGIELGEVAGGTTISLITTTEGITGSSVSIPADNEGYVLLQ